MDTATKETVLALPAIAAGFAFLGALWLMCMADRSWRWAWLHIDSAAERVRL